MNEVFSNRMKNEKKRIIKKGKNRLHGGAFHGGWCIKGKAGYFILTALLIMMMAFRDEIIKAVSTAIRGLL